MLKSCLFSFQLIGATCLYLAGKMKDNNLKIRDVMNVSYSTLHRGAAPLELGDQYWAMRDAIVQAELLIMRMLKFQVMPEHPHRVNLLFPFSSSESIKNETIDFVVIYWFICSTFRIYIQIRQM